MWDLREAQTKYVAEQTERAFREADIALGRNAAMNPRDIEWEHPNLSIKRLREAVAESAFPALLRSGVQGFLFDAYQAVGVIYPDLVRVVNSNKFEELYAPMYGAETPKQVNPSQKFEESRLQGLDVRVRNLKFGRILGVERELIDDDMTGQIVQRASQMGQRIRYVEEQVVMSAIVGATYTTAIGNRPSAGAKLSQPGLEAADIALMGIRDPLGNLILVQPDTLVVGPADKFNAAKLLNSALQPSVPGASGQTANTASSGGTGWTMTVNPLQGLYSLKVSRFLPTLGLDATNGPWYLMQAKTSIAFQDRDPLEVVPEARDAGESFDRDQYRWRTRRRFNAAVIESRYIYEGN